MSPASLDERTTIQNLEVLQPARKQVKLRPQSSLREPSSKERFEDIGPAECCIDHARAGPHQRFAKKRLRSHLPQKRADMPRLIW